MRGAFLNTAVWHAAPSIGAPLITANPPIGLGFDSPKWQPLRQAWLPTGPEKKFQPGWARVTWASDHLCYEAYFVGPAPHNRARTLNERTWELGDICEVFVEVAGGPGYVELHVTPENQRLQLLWRPGAFERFSAGEAPLAAATIPDPNWVQSTGHVTAAGWAISAILPAHVLGWAELSPELLLRTAVCRYDCGPRGEPVRLSSTAALTFPSYHRRAEWHLLVLDKTSSSP